MQGPGTYNSGMHFPVSSRGSAGGKLQRGELLPVQDTFLLANELHEVIGLFSAICKTPSSQEMLKDL
jgi:hypothetical protein